MSRVIAAFTPNHIGDVLLVEPAIAALKAGYPDAWLIVLTSAEGKAVLTNHPDIDELWVRQRGFKGWLAVTRRLKHRKPELAVSFSLSSLGLVLCAFFSRVHRRIGFAFRPLQSLLFTEKVHPHFQRHFIDDYLTLAEVAGGKASRRQPRLFVTETELTQAKERLRSLGWDGEKPILGVHPFSSVPHKEWGLRNFAELINSLREDWEFVPVIFGSVGERERANQLIQMTQAILAAGALSLREFIAAVTWCEIFVGGDSGPVHIAAALGIPTIALFGPTDPKRFGPLGESVVIIRSPTACMADITVDEVKKEALGLLIKVSAKR